MTDHVVRRGGARALRILVAVVLGAVVAAAVVVAAILSFELNPAGPVVVALVSIVGGSFLARTDDAVLKGIAVGLIVGGVAAVLLWPLFQVDSGGSIESLLGG
jgi:hypothetical protein